MLGDSKVSSNVAGAQEVLTGMIAPHEGAVVMSQTELGLAIVAAQNAETTQMQQSRRLMQAVGTAMASAWTTPLRLSASTSITSTRLGARAAVSTGLDNSA